ncbi:MAG: hypothetical protein IJH09_01700 [Clostridia bacterium]|nr:hypothetical protein [Clostridia bacterium]
MEQAVQNGTACSMRHVVNDRILQAKPTQQAENPSVLLLSEGFSAFAAFVSGLRPSRMGRPVPCAMTRSFVHTVPEKRYGKDPSTPLRMTSVSVSS